MSVRGATVVPRESSLARVLAASRNVSAPVNDRPEFRETDLLITNGTFEATGAGGGTIKVAYVQALDVTYQDDSVYNLTKFVTPNEYGREVINALTTIVHMEQVAPLPHTKTKVRERVLYYRVQTKVTGDNQRAIGAGIGLFWSLDDPPPVRAQPPVQARPLKEMLLKILSSAYATASVRAKVKWLVTPPVSFVPAPEIWEQPAEPPLMEPSYLGHIRLFD